jgi:hypothetical protein
LLLDYERLLGSLLEEEEYYYLCIDYFVWVGKKPALQLQVMQLHIASMVMEQSIGIVAAVAVGNVEVVDVAIMVVVVLLDNIVEIEIIIEVVVIAVRMFVVVVVDGVGT